MECKYLVYSIILSMLLVAFAYAIETDIAASDPTKKTWRQTDWSGQAGVEFIEEDNIETFAGYYTEGSTMLPAGDLEVGVYQGYINIFNEERDPGYANVNDIVLCAIGIILAADIPTESPSAQIYYANFEDWSDKPWGRNVSSFPAAHGDTVSEINSLAVTSVDFSQELFLYAGVTMSGGYAGLYVGDILYDQNGIYEITNWTYLDGPGNPADNPPTTSCTDIYALDGYPDHVLCATGDSGVISYYDGTGFTAAFVSNDETAYEISFPDPITPAIIALTGPKGNVYTGYFLYPYDSNFWVHEPDPPEENPVTLGSNDIYDHFVFGNYHYYAGGSPAIVYRRGGESGIEPTGDLPSDFSGAPTAVYSLGHVGNLVLAGTGDYGVLYGTRDNGVRWAPARAVVRDDTRIVTMLDLGALYPLIVLAGAEGEYGGLYVFAAPELAVLESSALHIDANDTHFGRVTWDADLNDGIVIVQVRTFNNPDTSDATPWLIPDPDDPDEVILNPDTVIDNGHRMEAIPSVDRGDRYLQYHIVLVSSDTGESPIFNEIRLGFGSLGYDSLLPEDHIHAVPNPVTGNVCDIHYALSADAEVTAEVYDINGRLVWSGSEVGHGLESGQFIPWNTSDVAPGVYVYRVFAQTGGGETDSAVKKVAVLK